MIIKKPINETWFEFMNRAKENGISPTVQETLDKEMKKSPEGIISHEFSGTIMCEKASKLGSILSNLYLNGETGHGILSDFGYTGSFVVIEEICGFTGIIEPKLYVEFIIKSVPEKEKTFEELYKGYVIKNRVNDYFVQSFIGLSQSSAREFAARFTKKEAMEYIKNIKGEFVIEDAC